MTSRAKSWICPHCGWYNSSGTRCGSNPLDFHGGCSMHKHSPPANVAEIIVRNAVYSPRYDGGADKRMTDGKRRAVVQTWPDGDAWG